MRKQILLIVPIMLAFALSGIAQTPSTMKYQAVARDDSGEILKNQEINLRISIHEGSITGSVTFMENHLLMTNNMGLIHLNIGEGSNQTGSLDQLNWGEHEHFIEIELDPDGGNNFIDMGTVQLLTVPYAFFAQNGVQFDAEMDCNENTEGMIRYNFETKQLEVCNGESWTELGGGTQGFNCGELLVDQRDGQSYTTVKIGSQCWMASNLNYGTFKESTSTNDAHSDVSNNGIVEKYAFDNDENNLEIYGALYDWNEMMDYKTNESSQGICPDGWHIPSYDEYLELVEEIGGWLTAGDAMKEGGSSGFEFPLGGNRREKGNFTGGSGTTGSVWTSTISESHPDSRAWNLYFIEEGANAAKATDLMVVGKSCRCVKN